MSSALKNRKLWLLAGVALALSAIHFSGASGYLSVESLRAHRHELTAFVAAHYWLSGIAFVGLYILIVASAVPCALLLTLTSGFFFGMFPGALFAMVGATTGATVMFLFARTLMGPQTLGRLGPTAQMLAANIRRNAWPYLLSLRLLPIVPFCIVNLIPALAGVSLLPFVATTLIGIIPASLIFSLAGSGLGDILDSGARITAGSILTPKIILGLTGLAALSLAAIPLRSRLTRRAEVAESGTPA